MRLNLERTTLLFICVTIVITIPAAAQRVSAQYTGPYTDSMGGGFNNPISAQMSTMLWNRIFYPQANTKPANGDEDVTRQHQFRPKRLVGSG